MPGNVPLPADHPALELEADRLLAALPRDPDYPACSERRLAERNRRTMNGAVLLTSRCAPPAESLRAEVRFLAAVSRLTPAQRLCANLWADGLTIGELARAMGVTRLHALRMLRVALRACYDAAPVSFRRFSHHTIYRPPSHVRPVSRRCRHCGEPFLPYLGAGRWCSGVCREAAACVRAQRGLKKPLDIPGV